MPLAAKVAVLILLLAGDGLILAGTCLLVGLAWTLVMGGVMAFVTAFLIANGARRPPNGTVQ